MQPRDFLADDFGSEQSNEIAPRDFLAESSLPKETLLASLTKVPYRIGEDIAHGAMNLAKNIPNYYEKFMNAGPEVKSTISQNPQQAAKQALAGFAELGQNAFNFPHDIANYASNRLNLIPENINQKIQMARMPSDTKEMINQTLGVPQNPGEEALRWGGRNVVNLLGAKGIGSALNPMNFTSKDIAKNILNKAEEIQNKYKNLYGKLFNEAEQKGYGDLSSITPKIDIETLRKYTPKNRLVNVEDFILNPNHETGHFAKSELLGLQRKLNRKETLTGAERKQLNAINDAVGNIKGNMFKDASGNIDEGMMKQYEKLQKGFKNEALPYRINAIKKYQAGEITAGELKNALSKGLFYAKRSLSHPALIARKNALPAAGIVSSAIGIPLLWNKLFGTGSPEQNR